MATTELHDAIQRLLDTRAGAGVETGLQVTVRRDGELIPATSRRSRSATLVTFVPRPRPR